MNAITIMMIIDCKNPVQKLPGRISGDDHTRGGNKIKTRDKQVRDMLVKIVGNQYRCKHISKGKKE